MARMTQRRKIQRFHLDGSGTEYPVQFKEDVLAAEEPLEIRVGGRSFAVTMRTPGDDFDLVAGFLVSEGIIRSQAELVSLRFCTGDAGGEQTFNVIEAQLRPDVAMPDTMRHVYTSSSCGICGTDSIDAVRKTLHFDPSQDALRVPVDLIAELPARLREAQALFDKTGGVHAAGLFKVDGANPELLCLREDVGRHNAVDKVVGWALRQDLLPLTGTVLQVSGRASFELVQKAALAGIPVLAAVSAPSSLAADLAAETGVTLIGFSRGHSLNVYAGHERLIRPRTASCEENHARL
ncbi:formate dehydrogenase accessory sulfurtransferase FdhD [Pseudarthrobacter sp. AB1]|uniref:formate dehydrogenase accessory sulfurtransferase FdhD n=1 Tax=Pseudarthrobacter sp. AB1 TaxID=2138309 RepID=UPI00186B72A1|nr:formate dehydrogenase accessory sulfurtransferase FdhD [Pseudarthrobacter sp. AB1]MBE4718075.1 formate dehydrogenase accessory sulfurtransferase FdhD [Pseudarthrobacter sp. AB1]